MTAGIFVNIVAWASYQRTVDITPYWWVLKSDGELNVKYPEAIELQKRLLEEEGHTIIKKGTKNIKYYVKVLLIINFVIIKMNIIMVHMIKI